MKWRERPGPSMFTEAHLGSEDVHVRQQKVGSFLGRHEKALGTLEGEVQPRGADFDGLVFTTGVYRFICDFFQADGDFCPFSFFPLLFSLPVWHLALWSGRLKDAEAIS